MALEVYTDGCKANFILVCTGALKSLLERSSYKTYGIKEECVLYNRFVNFTITLYFEIFFGMVNI
jgi:hypothetical protein